MKVGFLTRLLTFSKAACCSMESTFLFEGTDAFFIPIALTLINFYECGGKGAILC